ncbi:sel1 repeat family protein [Prevotella copri]|nr:sel1 repeat family protein [Segatella copri]MQN19379.1 sel1 repeat family protein [Segatella copri]
MEDHAVAFQWYMKAAELGYIYACYNVAECYYQGDGVEKDDSWAAFWYEMAAQQRDAQAQFSTGWFYMTGTGVKQDKRKGLKWIHRATAQGFEHAKQWCRDNGYSIY